MTIIDHAVFTFGVDHLAQKCDALAALREKVGDLLGRRDETAVEAA